MSLSESEKIQRRIRSTAKDMVSDLIWHEDPFCKGMDTDDFFPVNEEIAEIEMECCFSCVNRPICFVKGLDEGFGIWGGFSSASRRKLMQDEKFLFLVLRDMIDDVSEMSSMSDR